MVGTSWQLWHGNLQMARPVKHWCMHGKVYRSPRNQERCQPCYEEYYKSRNGTRKDRVQEGRNTHLKQYGLTPEEYDRMFIARKGRCDICGNVPKKLHVDHVHGSNPVVVRGLLCHGCNVGIGFLKENVQALKNAIEYLNRSS